MTSEVENAFCIDFLGEPCVPWWIDPMVPTTGAAGEWPGAPEAPCTERTAGNVATKQTNIATKQTNKHSNQTNISTVQLAEGTVA